MSRRGTLLFLTVGIVWGVPYFMIRVAIRDVSPEFLVFARTLPATLLLLPFALRTSGWSAVARRWRWLIVYTLVEFAIPWLMLFRAEQHLPSSTTGLLLASVPLISLLIARGVRTSEDIGRSRWLGVLVGLIGVAALVGFSARGDDLVALGELGFTAVGYAIGPMLISGQLRGLPGTIVVTTSLAIASLAYTPVALAHLPTRLHASTIWSIVGLVVLCTALGFLAFFALIAEVGPARATVVTYVNPAVAVLLGVVALHEPFTTGMAIGLPLVIIGSVFATRRRDSLATRTMQPSASSTRRPRAASSSGRAGDF